jgi:long-chain fatty acid transport protein
MKKGQLIVGAVPALMAALFSGHAGASGFQLLEQNGSGLGTAFAGSAAVADNASTIYFNPAGMTKLQAHEFSLGVDAVRPSFKFTNNSSSVAPAATGSNGGDAGGWTAVPNGYLSWALTKDLYLGVGVSAPFGLLTEYDSDWAGRFQAIKFDIKTVNVNPSIAYRLNDKVSLGFGVNWQKMDAVYETSGNAQRRHTGDTHQARCRRRCVGLERRCALRRFAHHARRPFVSFDGGVHAGRHIDVEQPIGVTKRERQG